MGPLDLEVHTAEVVCGEMTVCESSRAQGPRVAGAARREVGGRATSSAHDGHLMKDSDHPTQSGRRTELVEPVKRPCQWTQPGATWGPGHQAGGHPRRSGEGQIPTAEVPAENCCSESCLGVTAEALDLACGKKQLGNMPALSW